MSFFAAIVVFMSASSLMAEAPPVPSVVAVDSELEFALKSLFIEELGYTLIGAKPVTSEEDPYYLEMNSELIKRLHSFLKSAFQNSDKFILRMSKECDTGFDVELIHKTALRTVIRKNPELRSFIKEKFGIC